MIRSFIALAATTSIAAAGLFVAPGAVAADWSAAPESSPLPAAKDNTSLAVAKRVFAGAATPSDPSLTVAMRDLWLAKDDLSAGERREARSLLARPTDGAEDPQGFGYTTPEAAPVCNTRICLHYVATTVDAPPSIDWVNQSLATMDSVWTSEVDSLGYQAPPTDGVRGGSALFDVYLKDLGGQIYGYCAPEGAGAGRKAAGFCVLDNDFSASQFPLNDPTSNLTVTAAHEFFHAIQFGYDSREDGWMMESTATWMEERVATAVNDNRQYFPVSQLYAPQMPLDTYHQNGYQYGNWLFWEYLSNKYGIDIVKRAWDLAASHGGKPYSIQVLKKILAPKGGLTKVFANYANASLVPPLAFPEGAEYEWPKVPAAKLGPNKAARAKVKVHHLSSRSYRVFPKSSLKGGWKLQVMVDGPVRATSPAVTVLVHKQSGGIIQKTVRLNKRGDGQLRVPFDSRKVAAASITLANVSTRYRCNTRGVFACNGNSKDDRAAFTLTVRSRR